MKSNFERNKFIRKFWIISGSIGLALAVFLGMTTGLFYGVKTPQLLLMFWGSLGIFFVGSTILFLILYHQMDSVYGDLETISQSMNDIMEHDDNPPEEVYREGAVGVLYSNYYKMVRALQDSRNRELSEKIFLRDIISDISHQLKTPLASLNIFIDLLAEDKLPDDAKKKHVLFEAQNQLNRMEWMVLSMLKLARIEAGAIQFDLKKIKLQPVLSSAVESVKMLADKKHQKITIVCDADVEMTCDGDWLTEAIINLLKNASDYSGENTNISIELEQTAVYHRIYVKDEGPGIEEEEIPNIFKRFYRVHQEVNPNSVGIGLSLTKSIVEGMGGTIHVKSEVGKYTWFILTFVDLPSHK